MRGYGNIDYFRELDFMESLYCYIHLVKDLENELTLEALAMIINTVLGGSKGGEAGESCVDDIVEEFF